MSASPFFAGVGGTSSQSSSITAFLVDETPFFAGTGGTSSQSSSITTFLVDETPFFAEIGGTSSQSLSLIASFFTDESPFLAGNGDTSSQSLSLITFFFSDESPFFAEIGGTSSQSLSLIASFFTDETPFFAGTDGTSSQSLSLITSFFTDESPFLAGNGGTSSQSLSLIASFFTAKFPLFKTAMVDTVRAPISSQSSKLSFRNAAGLAAFGKGGFVRTTSFSTGADSSCQIESSFQSKADSTSVVDFRFIISGLKDFAGCICLLGSGDTASQSLSLNASTGAGFFSESASSTEEEKGQPASESIDSLPNKQVNHGLLNNTRSRFILNSHCMNCSFFFLHPLQILFIHLCNLF